MAPLRPTKLRYTKLPKHGSVTPTKTSPVSALSASGLVLEKLNLGWSPQQISGRLKKEITEGVRPKREYINHESIYQFLYDPAQKDHKLWAYLPRSHWKRRRWLGRRSRSVKIPNREEFGHWEGDTIVGYGHKPEFTLR
jgi:IS30 family transposase